MPTLSSDQAFVLARAFHDLSVEIGNYRFDNWDDLTPNQRQQLENFQFDVLNDSSKFNAMSISIALDDLQGTLDRIGQATAQMTQAIQNLKEVGKTISIATAAVTLGAAIISMNPGAIVAAGSGAVASVSGG